MDSEENFSAPNRFHSDQQPLRSMEASGTSGTPSGTPGGYSSPWQEKQRTNNRKSKIIVFSSIAAIIVLIGIIVGVAVGVTKNVKRTNNTASGSPSNANSTVHQTDPNDPSSFVKDPNLHQSFYAFAYTPQGSQLPNCGSTLANVINDIQLLSQLTNRIRLYGADCNQSALVLEAIKQTKVNMKVYLGNYNLPNDGGQAYQRQRTEIQNALQAYGTNNIAGVTVGNEFMLNYLTDAGLGSGAINTAAANQGAQLLTQNITDTRNMLKSMSISNVPVGTSDAGAFFNNLVLAAVDYGMANVHPWFANVTIDQAAAWTNQFFQDTDITASNGVSNKPTMYIAETGWPTNSTDVGSSTNGASQASIANLQKFLDTFVCQANQNGTQYFFFEYFDEPWKTVQFGGVEGYWGLFYSNRTLKPVTIPNCQITT